ncbi:FMN-linked oxidoreductase [Ophiobolus disseminans]|uniref:FMN-linked oxidoreductase n=1 Tax=Ophiobolus disseminans TaxID=1469910 RepID=A0A6A6ZLE4_9PLEO|nr:FMN-linked oxidoreductase [Ophiobolus disseminans]
MIVLPDFEVWAKKVLFEVAWNYYRSAADQERSYEGSVEALLRYFFRPRMLRDMSNGSLKTSFLGFESELPIYIAPAAMCKLGHPLGEVNWTKAARDFGIVQSIYIDERRELTTEILQKVERLGAKAIIFTVDVGWWSKRNLEIRHGGELPTASLGAFVAMGGRQDRNLSWNYIAWVKAQTSLPVIVKGVQTIGDIELSVKNGADAVMISNHGGRQVDHAPAPIDILYEL